MPRNPSPLLPVGIAFCALLAWGWAGAAESIQTLATGVPENPGRGSAARAAGALTGGGNPPEQLGPPRNSAGEGTGGTGERHPGFSGTPPATNPAPQAHKSLLHLGQDLAKLSPGIQIATIVGSTLISEDLTCITVGTLIQHHKIPWPRGGGACFLGIYIGDLTFFFLGRFAGARLLKLRFFSRALGEKRIREFGEWFDRKPWAAIMACRFLPGIRVPLYLSVGALSHRTRAFFWWTCFFAFVWTPALIGAVVLLGDAITGPLEFVFGRGWWTIPLTIIVILGIVRLAILLSTPQGRAKLKGRCKTRGEKAVL